MSNNLTKIIIMGAAGRDFHNFNVCFRNNPAYHVAAFTATQIPDIEGRTYPGVLAGDLYPNGIPIYPEAELIELIHSHSIDQVVFAYSDVPYHYVMSRGAMVNAAGADFIMQGPDSTQLTSTRPVISVCAVRTGSGKTSVSKKVCQILRKLGKTSSVVRHPMPYGDLAKQAVQRFSCYEDLDAMGTTIEEREEYETHIDVADPHRAGDGLTYYPGEINLRMADVVVINKQDTAELEMIEQVRRNIIEVNPDARIIDSASPVTVENPGMIRGKRVLVVEDGPTLTHGGMKYGAGTIGANKAGASEIVDPRPYTVGTITETFNKYPDTGALLPAMGYSPQQVRDLEETINRVDCDAVVIGTPIDLTREISINKPSTRVRYEIKEIGEITLETVIEEFLRVGA